MKPLLVIALIFVTEGCRSTHSSGVKNASTARGAISYQANFSYEYALSQNPRFSQGTIRHNGKASPIECLSRTVDADVEFFICKNRQAVVTLLSDLSGPFKFYHERLIFYRTDAARVLVPDGRLPLSCSAKGNATIECHSSDKSVDIVFSYRFGQNRHLTTTDGVVIRGDLGFNVKCLSLFVSEDVEHISCIDKRNVVSLVTDFSGSARVAHESVLHFYDADASYALRPFGSVALDCQHDGAMKMKCLPQ